MLEVFCAAAAGFCAVVLPVALAGSTKHPGTEFLPFVGAAVYGMRLYSLGLLFGIGVVLGLVGHASVWLTGPATMATLPIWSVVDMALGADHNLFPIEWLIYGVESLFGMAGGGAGRLLRWGLRAARGSA